MNMLILEILSILTAQRQVNVFACFFTNCSIDTFLNINH